MATDDLVVGQEVRVRARKMYDAYGRTLLFEGIISSISSTTADIYLRFNGAMLDVRGIPLEMVAAYGAGDD